MTEMNSQMKRNTEQAAEGHVSGSFSWDPVFLFAKFSNPIPLLIIHCYSLPPQTSGQCLLFFGLKQKPKGKRILVVQSPEIILTWATGWAEKRDKIWGWYGQWRIVRNSQLPAPANLNLSFMTKLGFLQVLNMFLLISSFLYLQNCSFFNLYQWFSIFYFKQSIPQKSHHTRQVAKWTAKVAAEIISLKPSLASPLHHPPTHPSPGTLGTPVEPWVWLKLVWELLLHSCKKENMVCYLFV